MQMDDSALSSMDGSFNSISPDPADGSLIAGDSPKGKDWARILQKSEDDERSKKQNFTNDAVHGNIEVPPLCFVFWNTEIFGRLRRIKQLGTAHYVYPCAKHTRFEHSLGVMHLAGEFIDSLRNPENGDPNCCTTKDKHLVMLAGLLHDLGHGPFSHLWEQFVHEARPGYEWRHEETSIAMMNLIIKENSFELEKLGMDADDEIFVKELITGPSGEDGTYLGRGPEKYFLYEIVANKVSSIDVDKWDYFRRDDRAMKIGLTFDYKRFIKMSRLKKVDGKVRLALMDKEAMSVQKLFEDRARLHRDGYQHKVVKKCDRMVIDALLAADDYFIACRDRQGNFVKMSHACDDPYAFAQLSDNVLDSIRHHWDVPGVLPPGALAPAKEIISRMESRRLYSIIGTVRTSTVSFSQGMESYKKSLAKLTTAEGSLLRPDDLVLSTIKINTGFGRKNPVERVLFMDSRGSCESFSTKYLKDLKDSLRIIEEETLLVMLRLEGKELVKEAKQIFGLWKNVHFNSEEFDAVTSKKN